MNSPLPEYKSVRFVYTKKGVELEICLLMVSHSLLLLLMFFIIVTINVYYCIFE